MEDLKGTLSRSDSEIYCNCCGKVINHKGGIGEDYLEVKKAWGYFSSKDLTGHAFNLCEACYDKLISQFKIPVEEFVGDDIPMYSEDELVALNRAYKLELCK